MAYVNHDVGSTTLPDLPETNGSPLKIGLPNRNVVFQPSIFRRYVSFREGNIAMENGRPGLKDVLFPIENYDFPASYVSLPEGILVP